MRLLWPQMSLELKGLRLYATQILISLVLIPGSYLFVILLSSGTEASFLSYQLCGFVVASLIGSLVSLLAFRVSNMMQPTVLELYAALPARTGHIVGAQSMVYILLAIPQIAVATVLAASYAQSVNIGLLLVGIMSVVLLLTLMGLFLGTAIRNPFTAQGMLPLVAWVLLMLSPVYYPSEGLSSALFAVAVLNPVTHALNVIRVPVGNQAIVPLGVSYIYLGVAAIVMLGYVHRRLRRVYILERFF